MSNYERDDSVTEDVREGADDLGDAKKEAQMRSRRARSRSQTASRTLLKTSSRVIATTTAIERSEIVAVQ